MISVKPHMAPVVVAAEEEVHNGCGKNRDDDDKFVMDDNTD
jgi:hypothetical protein